MAYDLEEQEQLAAIKSWWTQYGKLAIVTVVAGVLVVGGTVRATAGR
jgi:predicted negative regulator of RcsB-dependent stress response